jgi:hypothetical protein
MACWAQTFFGPRCDIELRANLWDIDLTHERCRALARLHASYPRKWFAPEAKGDLVDTPRHACVILESTRTAGAGSLPFRPDPCE